MGRSRTMKPEDKQLVIQDLCGRLPYEVKCRFEDAMRVIDGESSPCYDSVLSAYHLEIFIRLNDFYIKPYLRPMSSMTEEEAKELLFVRLASKFGESCAYIKNFIRLNEVSFRKKAPYEGSIAVWFSFEEKIHDTSQTREYSRCDYLGLINDITLAEIDWLNAHHFDYRGLIPKGSAISTEVFNPYYS